MSRKFAKTGTVLAVGATLLFAGMGCSNNESGSESARTEAGGSGRMSGNSPTANGAVDTANSRRDTPGSR